MFKYELGELIYYMGNDRICSAPIMSRTLVDNEHNDWDATTEQAQSFMPFGKAGIYYNTCHGIYTEDQVSTDPNDITTRLLDQLRPAQ